jgi:hypothetical protein
MAVNWKDAQQIPAANDILNRYRRSWALVG